MNQGEDFAQSTVAIIGLGLMGGSMALALRGRCKQLLGIDRNKETIKRALMHGVVDKAHHDVKNFLPEADIIILALPVRSIVEMIRCLPQIHPGPAVVMDLGSTKVEILHAMSELPGIFDPIGGHPMCGKETSGLENAEPGLYSGAPFALTPLERTSSRARSAAETLVQTVGAKPIWLEPETHDTWVASISHLPYLLAVALVGTALPEAAPLAGPGFRDVSRLAGSGPQMMVDILATNRDPVLKMVNQFQEKLKELKNVIRGGDTKTLKVLLESASQQRDFLTGHRGTNEHQN